MSLKQPAPLNPVVPEPEERNSVPHYLATLSPRSQRMMRQSLDLVAGELTGGEASALTCPWAGIRHEHSCWLRATLLERYRPASVNRHLAAMRGVLKHCFRLGLMSAESYYDATNIADLPVDRTKRSIRADDIHRLFATLDNDTSPLAARDAALLATLYGAGLRCSEGVALLLSDFDGRSLSIRGRGAQARTVPASIGVRERLEAWLTVRGRQNGPMFCRIRRGGCVLPQPLSPGGIVGACERRADAAGIDRFSPNDLRQRFVADLGAAGGNLGAVNRLAGRTSRVPV